MSVAANSIAKLFNTEIGDGLAFKNTDEDGDPCITFLIEFADLSASLELGFRDFDARDEKFESIDEEAFVNTIRVLGS